MILEDYPEVYTDLVKGIPELDALQTIKLDGTDIPYWKEVLTYYHYPDQNRWQGFRGALEQAKIINLSLKINYIYLVISIFNGSQRRK